MSSVNYKFRVRWEQDGLHGERRLEPPCYRRSREQTIKAFSFTLQHRATEIKPTKKTGLFKRDKEEGVQGVR